MTYSISQPDLFVIRTSRLILLPSVFAIQNPAYTKLYSRLHGTPKFTEMAFGPSWGIRCWDDEAITSVIRREIDRSWRVRGIGDFAVGLRQDSFAASAVETETNEGLEIWKIDGIQELESLEWIGYVGVRDATTTSTPGAESYHSTSRPWTQMIELRYGFDPGVWGQGYGTEAAKAVMWWCKKHIGAERFVAETELTNVGSGKILKKCGFEELHGGEEVIWGMKGTKEWGRWATGVVRPERGLILKPDPQRKP